MAFPLLFKNPSSFSASGRMKKWRNALWKDFSFFMQLKFGLSAKHNVYVDIGHYVTYFYILLHLWYKAIWDRHTFYYTAQFWIACGITFWIDVSLCTRLVSLRSTYRLHFLRYFENVRYTGIFWSKDKPCWRSDQFPYRAQF